MREPVRIIDVLAQVPAFIACLGGPALIVALLHFTIGG